MATYPGGSNTYIPSHEASGKLVIDFSRNPKDFALAKYAQIVPAAQQVGQYLRMTLDEAARVLDDDDADSDWPDGHRRPKGSTGLEAFVWETFRTQRKAYPYTVGDLASGQASWDVLAHHGRIHAQKAMTRRTVRSLKKLTTAGNWGTHTEVVASISGITGRWDLSTTARMDIMKSIHFALDLIRLDTNGVVKPGEAMLVMSPGCARKIASCQEIADFVKGSPAAKEYIRGEMGPNAQYGLPDRYAGVEIVVEDAVKVTNRKGGTRAPAYCLADATPFICSRPGGIAGVEGAPSFSTFTLFAKEEMTVEVKHEPDDRLTAGCVVDDVAPVLTAGITGYLFQTAVA